MADRSAKRYIYIVLALLFAAMAALGSYQVLTYKANTGSVTVWVAKTAIDARTQINPDEVEPLKFAMPSYPGASPYPVGKVTMVGVTPGEVIINNMLALNTASSGLSARVPAGMFAMAIPVNQVTGVNGAVQPGDRVDLVLAGGPAGATDVAADVLVLNKTASTLTLEVSQGAALTVAGAETKGTLTVLLRGIGSD